MKSQNEKFRQNLEEITRDPSSRLRAAVAREIMESDDPVCFMNDLLTHGCSSGMVSSLIYYNDSHAFYERHYNEIESLRYEYENSLGESVLHHIKGDLKNWMAWFSFEETARQIYYELE